MQTESSPHLESITPPNTMINEEFTIDIIAEIEKGMAAIHQDSSSISNNDLTKYMVNLPVGKAGRQKWDEVWTLTSTEPNHRFIILYQENENDRYTVEFLDTLFSKTICPIESPQFPLKVTSPHHLIFCKGKPMRHDFRSDGQLTYFYPIGTDRVVKYIFNNDQELEEIVAGARETDVK